VTLLLPVAAFLRFFVLYLAMVFVGFGALDAFVLAFWR